MQSGASLLSRENKLTKERIGQFNNVDSTFILNNIFILKHVCLFIVFVKVLVDCYVFCYVLVYCPLFNIYFLPNLSKFV